MVRHTANHSKRGSDGCLPTPYSGSAGTSLRGRALVPAWPMRPGTIGRRRWISWAVLERCSGLCRDGPCSASRSSASMTSSHRLGTPGVAGIAATGRPAGVRYAAAAGATAGPAAIPKAPSVALRPLEVGPVMPVGTAVRPARGFLPAPAPILERAVAQPSREVGSVRTRIPSVARQPRRRRLACAWFRAISAVLPRRTACIVRSGPCVVRRRLTIRTAPVSRPAPPVRRRDPARPPRHACSAFSLRVQARRCQKSALLVRSCKAGCRAQRCPDVPRSRRSTGVLAHR